jgi:hypothetical protein
MYNSSGAGRKSRRFHTLHVRRDPGEYVDRVLERIRNVEIRGEPIVVKVATPRDGGTDRRGGPPKRGKGRATTEAPGRPARRLISDTP